MLHSMIIDDFHPDFEGLREFADYGEFGEVVSPADGVKYPGICPMRDVGVSALLAAALGRPVTVGYQFMRLSLAGAEPPHWAHHDGTMGDYSLMLYMTRAEYCRGGTALLEHLEHGLDVPDEIWKRDTNQRSQWRQISMCPMLPNRAFIFRSSLWHAAMPFGGFGGDAYDGRLVLTAFFS